MIIYEPSVIDRSEKAVQIELIGALLYQTNPVKRISEAKVAAATFQRPRWQLSFSKQAEKPQWSWTRSELAWS